MDLEYSIKSTSPYQNGQNKREKTPTKTPKKVLLVKGPWTPQEDSLLKQMVETHGIRNWTKIAKMLSGRVGKQCRERWHNHLRPHIKKDTWTEEEEEMLIRAHEAVGKKWVEIARRLPGRSENSIKNHWNATMRKLGTKKNNKKPNFEGSLLQNYIRSIIALPSNKNNNNNNNYILNNFVVENGESSSQTANDAASADHDGHADRQIQPENSDLIFVNNRVVNPGANLVYNDNDHGKKIINLGVENDNSLFSNSYGGFRSYMDEMAAMEEERNVDIQMRSEIESLMKGPAEIKKEKDFMEMIFQGKI
ncbi:hypothetical protein TIFTF001_029714 [Ficus carica]|uniref:Uncharacterized protein n=1 Tax=Ficus carica TaxID=3494 RepID=A0AA88J363_FICCA|nr:hypothetical protein TIFTF001_029714 [Ficus carica]